MVDLFSIDRALFAPGQATPESTINEMVDDAIRSVHSLYSKVIGADVDASVASDSSTSEYRKFLRAGVIKFTGSVAGSPTGGVYLLPSGLYKRFVFHNGSSSDITVKVPGATGVTVRAGLIARLALIGTDVISLDHPDIMSFPAVAGSPTIDGANDRLLFYDNGQGLRKIAPDNLPSASPGGSPTPQTRMTFRGALVRKNASQNVGAGVTATITWGAEVFDTDGFYGGGGSPSPDTSFFIPNGITCVQLIANLRFSASGGGNNGHEFMIVKNGAASVDYVGGAYSTKYAFSAPHSLLVTAPIKVVAGDRFSVVYHNDGTGTGTADTQCHFGIRAWNET